MKKKENDSPEWRRVKVILKIAGGVGIISFISYVISNGFTLEIIKNGFILGIFMVVFITYFGCGLFANSGQSR